jgi:hypothetical protein
MREAASTMSPEETLVFRRAIEDVFDEDIDRLPDVTAGAKIMGQWPDYFNQISKNGPRFLTGKLAE